MDSWLQDAVFTDKLLSSRGPASSATKFMPYSIEIKFVVVTNGNINPVWKLLPVTFNNGGTSLLTAGRTRTHDVLITIGPADVIRLMPISRDSVDKQLAAH